MQETENTAQDDRGIFNQAQPVARYEPTYLLSSLDAYTPPNTRSFRADSYWVRYSPVMNPVARLAWLRFLLHIPGRCQGPHRRQRSLPKSQPCYTDECVCPVLWSRLSASVCLGAHLCFSACTSLSASVCAPTYVVTLENEIGDERVGWSEISVFCMQVQISLVYMPQHQGGLQAEANSHNPHRVVTIKDPRQLRRELTIFYPPSTPFIHNSFYHQ